MSAETRIELPGLGEPHPQGCALYVLVDAEQRATAYSRDDLPAGTASRLVHVISRWSRGEVRGYRVIGNVATVRQPNYVGDWPEVDRAVEAALGVRVADARRSA